MHLGHRHGGKRPARSMGASFRVGRYVTVGPRVRPPPRDLEGDLRPGHALFLLFRDAHAITFHFLC